LLRDPDTTRTIAVLERHAGGSAATGAHVSKTLQSFDGVAEDIILSVRVVGELELGYKLGCVHSVRQKLGGLRSPKGPQSCLYTEAALQWVACLSFSVRG
jgi:hypothetical protein